MDGGLAILDGISDMFLDFTTGWAVPHNHTLILIDAPWRLESIKFPCTRFYPEMVVAGCYI